MQEKDSLEQNLNALKANLNELLSVVKRLRAECPWDKEQTPESLTRYVLEEAYELTEAIFRGDSERKKDELADCLFQVVLQAELANEESEFDLNDIVLHLKEKLVRRHPHVFGGDPADSAHAVKEKWEKIKAQEKLNDKFGGGLILPSEVAFDKYPALLNAFKIGKNSETWKFDWENPKQVSAKVEEEFNETLEATAQANFNDTEEEIGDLLFAVAQWARHLKIEPEEALRKANRKYEKRFSLMLKHSEMDPNDFKKLSLEDKEKFWSSAKKEIKGR